MASWKDTFENVKRTAITKSRDFKEINKLNEEISDYNQDINDVLVEIGEYVLKNELLKDDENIQEWFSQILFVREKIEAKREKILEIKNISICSRCGAEYPRTSRICTKCGNEVANVQKLIGMSEDV